jgi:hypothetical protein
MITTSIPTIVMSLLLIGCDWLRNPRSRAGRNLDARQAAILDSRRIEPSARKDQRGVGRTRARPANALELLVSARDAGHLSVGRLPAIAKGRLELPSHQHQGIPLRFLSGCAYADLPAAALRFYSSDSGP